MKSVMKRSLLGGGLLSMFVLAQGVPFLMPTPAGNLQSARAQPPRGNSAADSSNQYTGMNKCAACHFRQYRDWQSTPHGNAFKILPRKYRNDADCLACHTTKVSDAALETGRASAHAMGVSCESCHGPGGDHANYALSFVGREQVFTDDELTTLRSKIERLALDQCIKCHTSKAHKPHPEFDREDSATQRLPSPSAGRQSGFFDVHGREST